MIRLPFGEKIMTACSHFYLIPERRGQSDWRTEYWRAIKTADATYTRNFRKCIWQLEWWFACGFKEKCGKLTRAYWQPACASWWKCSVHKACYFGTMKKVRGWWRISTTVLMNLSMADVVWLFVYLYRHNHRHHETWIGPCPSTFGFGCARGPHDEKRRVNLYIMSTKSW